MGGTMITYMQVFLVCVFALFASSCHSPSDRVKQYRAAVRSGFKKIPETLEIEELFGESDHFITHYGMEEGPLIWNTEVFFYGRYSLTMQVSVQLNGRYGEIVRVLDEPKFYFHEVGSINITERGLVGAKIAVDKRFGQAEWKKLVAAKGDFSAIGISVHRDRAVEGFDKYVKAQREPRMQVRPDWIETLKHENPNMRLLAARKLGEIGADANEAVSALKQALNDKDPSVREAAATALKKIDP